MAGGTPLGFAPGVTPDTVAPAPSPSQAFVGGVVTGSSFNGVPLQVGQGAPASVPGFYTGVGVPTFSAPNGSMYTRFDSATVGARWYVNTSGVSTVGTTWTALAAP